MSGVLLGEVIVTMFVIMDPVGNVPIFLSVTRRLDARQRHRAALVAVATAVLVIGVFAAVGRQLLDYLHVSVPALQGAGGLLLLLVALELLTGAGGSESDALDPDDHIAVAMVPLGTPLLAGPGAILELHDGRPVPLEGGVGGQEAHPGLEMALAALVGREVTASLLAIREGRGHGRDEIGRADEMGEMRARLHMRQDRLGRGVGIGDAPAPRDDDQRRRELLDQRPAEVRGIVRGDRALRRGVDGVGRRTGRPLTNR